MKKSKTLKKIGIQFIFLLLIPVMIHAQDISIDKKLGAEGSKSIEASMGIYTDQEKINVLESLGQKLVAGLDQKLFDYKFYIVDMGEPNAFALPGGYIYATRGLLALANNEDELAGVIGHEIIHSNNRHSVKQQKKGILPSILSLPQAITGALLGENAGKIFSPLSKSGKAINASYSRKDENEADKLGVALSAKSGYNPESLAVILNTLNQTIEVFTGQKEEPSYFSDHPLTSDRIERINKESDKIIVSETPKLFKDNREFLYFIDGLMLGPNPKQGIFQENYFMHPELNFKFRIPSNWLKENSPSAVAAGDSTGSSIVMLEIETKYNSANEAANDYTEQVKKKSGKKVKVISQDINGLPSKCISIETSQKNTPVRMVFYWIEYQGTIFKFSGASTTQYANQVIDVIESFDKTTGKDIESIKIRKLKVVKAREGENIESISARTGNIISAELTAVANNIPKDKVFKEAELLKIVINEPYQK